MSRNPILTHKKHLVSDPFHFLRQEFDRLFNSSPSIEGIQPEFEAFRSGGFRVNPFSAPVHEEPVIKDTPEVHASTPEDKEMDDTLLAQLNKLSELRKKGILPEDKFIFERKKVLRH